MSRCKLADPERLADEVFLLCEGARITAQSVGSEGLSSRLGGMLEALVADHARRGKQGELHGQVMSWPAVGRASARVRLK